MEPHMIEDYILFVTVIVVNHEGFIVSIFIICKNSYYDVTNNGGFGFQLKRQSVSGCSCFNTLGLSPFVRLHYLI
jgi:hypothetical protein